MPTARLPLTYEECRARFRHAAWRAGVDVTPFAIAASGPNGEQLSLDVGALGSSHPEKALVLLSGTHGVEGFLGSALQCDLLERVDASAWPRDLGVLFVHAVNPWGMAWWRRQNESNVDLNRNWRRDEIAPIHNDAYDELHALACPDTDTLPDVSEMLRAAQRLVDDRGLVWVRDGLTVGQYRHPDGLFYGGERTEASNAILQRLVPERLAGAQKVLTLDLHTAHGPRCAVTALSDKAPDSPQTTFLASIFERVEATADNPDATTGLKSGQIANGFADVLPDAECFATSLEFGTVDDLTQLGATYQEMWVHRRGNRNEPDHRAAIWAYRCCFTPDDPEWQATCFAKGQRALDDALAAVSEW